MKENEPTAKRTQSPMELAIARLEKAVCVAVDHKDNLGSVLMDLTSRISPILGQPHGVAEGPDKARIDVPPKPTTSELVAAINHIAGTVDDLSRSIMDQQDCVQCVIDRVEL